MIFARRVLAIAWKDLVAEWRDRESITAMCFFAFLVLFLFNFALGGDQALIRGASSGLLWLAFAFTAVLGLARSIQGELANDCLDGLLLYPAEREAIFLGKLCSSFSVILLVELFSFPIFAVLYNMDIWSQFPKLLLITVPATLGFATAGTLLSTMTVGLRAREAMLPFLRTEFGNPSSSHPWGKRARDAVEEARGRVARLLGAAVDEVTCRCPSS